MSDNQNPTPPEQIDSGSKSDKWALSSAMTTHIGIITFVGIASILLMLFGQFEGKAIRIISTLILFAVFTVFTALDSTSGQSSRYVKISQIASVYMLSLGLVQVWGTLSVAETHDEEIIFRVLGIIIATKAAALLIQRISDYIHVEQSQLSSAAKTAAGAAVIASVLYTLPIGLNEFFDFEDLYWKIATAALLLSGLALSVTGLLVWYYKDKERERELEPKEKEQEYIQPMLRSTGKAQPAQAQVVRPAEISDRKELKHNSVPEESIPQFARPVRSALPWPVFPNGYPLPAKANGRPDFDALKSLAESYIRAESQWF